MCRQNVKGMKCPCSGLSGKVREPHGTARLQQVRAWSVSFFTLRGVCMRILVRAYCMACPMHLSNGCAPWLWRWPAVASCYLPVLLIQH